MTRRASLCGLATLATCLVLFGLGIAADAPQPASPRRIGLLLVARSPEHQDVWQFRQGLMDAGYSEGHDVLIEWRSANGDYSRLPQLAHDLVQSKVDVIVVESTVAALAVKRATSIIPIVMASVADPVGSGLVSNLAHPGGNVTGVSNMITDLDAKRLQLLKELIPRVARVAVLWNPDTPFHTKTIKDLKAAAPAVSMGVSFFSVRTPDQFGPAFAAVHQARAQALYVIEDPFFFNHRKALAKLALEAHLPTVFATTGYVDAGGLIAYGVDYGEGYRISARYVDQIFKGAKPGELPIEQPTKFELVVNLKTAKAVGITIPDSILQRADAVIR